MFSKKILVGKKQKKHDKLVDSIDVLVDGILSKNEKSSDLKFKKIYSSDEFLRRKTNRGPFIRIKNNMPVRKILAAILTFILIFVLIPASLPYLYGDYDSDVFISIAPQSVHGGDVVFINVTIPSSYRIRSVTANMGDIETIDLLLLDNSSDNQLWQAKWAVHDADLGEYFATIEAVDAENTSYTSMLSWNFLSSENATDETETATQNSNSVEINESSTDETSQTNSSNDNKASNVSVENETAINVSLIKPQPPSDFSAKTYDQTRIDLSWVKGTGANNTYIVRKIDSYPVDGTEGTVVYNGTGSSYSDTKLASSTNYYYKAWSYNQWTYNGTTIYRWSDEYVSANTRTDTISPSIFSEEEPTINEGIYSKRVIVRGSLQERNFTSINVTVPEIRYAEQIDLALLNDENSMSVKNYKTRDANNNGLVDTISWNAYSKSDEIYEVKVDFNKVRFLSSDTDTICNRGTSYTANIYSSYVNYYDAKEKQFLPIDTSIISSGKDGFAYENTKNKFETYFDDSTARVQFVVNSSSITYYLVDQEFMQENKNYTVSVDGSRLTYGNIYDNVDVRYTVNSERLLEEFIVNKPLDITTISEEFEISGAFYKMMDDKSIQFYSMAGEPVFQIPRPVMWEEMNETNQCYGLHYEMEEYNGRFILTKVIDADGLAWLKGNNRSYPVIIDASTNIQPSTEDIYIYKNGENKYYSYVKFDISSILSGCTVSDVFFRVYCSGAGGDGDATFNNVGSQTWTEATAAATIYGYSTYDTTSKSSGWGTSTGWMQSVSLKNIFDRNYNAGNTYCTIRVMDPDATATGADQSYDTTYVVVGASGSTYRFYSRTYSTAANRPLLRVYYNDTTAPSTAMDDISNPTDYLPFINGTATDNVQVTAVKIRITNVTDASYYSDVTNTWGIFPVDNDADPTDGFWDGTSENWYYDCVGNKITWGNNKQYTISARAYDGVQYDASASTDTFYFNTTVDIINCSTNKSSYIVGETVKFTASVNCSMDTYVRLLIVRSEADLEKIGYSDYEACIAYSGPVRIISQPQLITATMTAKTSTTWYAKVCNSGGESDENISDITTYVPRDSGCQAFEGGTKTDGGFNAGSEDEFLPEEYETVSTDDETAVRDTDVSGTDHQYHRFRFYIPQDVNDIVQVDITYRVRGSNAIEGGHSLWVKESGSWTEKDSGTLITKETLTAQYTSNFEDIISSTTLEVGGQADPVNPLSDLRSYYMEVNVTNVTICSGSFTVTAGTASLDVFPNSWSIGNVWIGGSNMTTGYYFNLTNDGDVTINVQIKASNATNVTTSAEWKLNATPSYNNFTLQYKKNGDAGWTAINTSYDTFITSLGAGLWKTFDLKMFMATTSNTTDPMSLQITVKSVAA